MSAPAPMKFPKLIVEITRDEKTRRLAARVIQDGLRGPNLLVGSSACYRIESAKNIAVGRLVPERAGIVEFVTLASPDAKLPYAARRREITRETSS